MKKHFIALCAVSAALAAFSLSQSRPRHSFDHINLKTGREPGPVAFGDFNGDGRTDIVVGNTSDATVTVFLNQGHGVFHQGLGSPMLAGHSPNDIAVADMNHDGLPDLVIANHDSPFVTILLGQSDGRFAPSAASPVRVDVRPHPHGVAVADFNHDGNPDVAVESWATDEIKVFMGDGHGGLKLPGAVFKVGKHPYERLRSADLNGDGNPDIITTDFEQAAVTVLLGDGKGSFKQAAGSPFAAGDDPFAVVIADFNHDGHPDLAVANFSGQGTDFSKDAVNILYGDGTGQFRRGPTLATGHCPLMIAAGDIDGDGLPDIAVSNMRGDSVTLLLNHGGRFDREDVAVGHHPEGIGIAKLLEGRPASIVVTNMNDDTAEILTLAAPK